MADINTDELKKLLTKVDYPCSKDDLLDAARETAASEELMNAIDSLGRNQFDSPTEVTSALGVGQRPEWSH